MIPTDVLARAKAALSKVRNDRATVRRINPDSPVIDDVVVYTDLPCHLSRSSLAAQNGADTGAQTNTVYTLFVDDTVLLKQGDKIEVCHQGQIFQGVAGAPFKGNLNLSVRLESVAVS